MLYFFRLVFLWENLNQQLECSDAQGREYFATDITDNDALQALVKTLSEGDDRTDVYVDGGDDEDRGRDKDKDKDTHEASGTVRPVAGGPSSVLPPRIGRPAVALPCASHGIANNGNMVGYDSGRHGNQPQAMKHKNKEAGKTFTGENDHEEGNVGLITKTAKSDPAAKSQSVPGDRRRGKSDALSVAGREVVHPAQFRKSTKEIDAQLDQLRDAVLMRRSARAVPARIGRHGHGGVERTSTREPFCDEEVGGDDLATVVRLGKKDDRDVHDAESTDDGTTVGFVLARAQVDAQPPGNPATMGDEDGGATEQGDNDNISPLNATTEAEIAKVMRTKPSNRRRCIAAKRRRDRVGISITEPLGSKTACLSRGDDLVERQKKSDLNDPFLRVFLQRQFESERLPFLFAARSASRFHGYTVNDALEMVKRQAGRIPPLA